MFSNLFGKRTNSVFVCAEMLERDPYAPPGTNLFSICKKFDSLADAAEWERVQRTNDDVGLDNFSYGRHPVFPKLVSVQTFHGSQYPTNSVSRWLFEKLHGLERTQYE